MGCAVILNRRKYTDKELEQLLKSMVILIDSREKVNDHITNWFDKKNVLYSRITLPSFDYSFMLPKNEELGIIHDQLFYNDCSIERKNSLEELSGNFSQGRVAFNDEFSRTRCKRKHLLIENGSYHDIVTGNYNTKYNSKSYLGSLHSFETKYDLHVRFMPDREDSATYILATFQYYLRFLLK